MQVSLLVLLASKVAVVRVSFQADLLARTLQAQAANQRRCPGLCAQNLSALLVDYLKRIRLTAVSLKKEAGFL